MQLQTQSTLQMWEQLPFMIFIKLNLVGTGVREGMTSTVITTRRIEKQKLKISIWYTYIARRKVKLMMAAFEPSAYMRALDFEVMSTTEFL